MLVLASALSGLSKTVLTESVLTSRSPITCSRKPLIAPSKSNGANTLYPIVVVRCTTMSSSKARVPLEKSGPQNYVQPSHAQNPSNSANQHPYQTLGCLSLSI